MTSGRLFFLAQRESATHTHTLTHVHTDHLVVHGRRVTLHYTRARRTYVKYACLRQVTRLRRSGEHRETHGRACLD